MLVSGAAELRAALEGIADLEPVGVDVERADWDRYWRRAALIQVGGDSQVVLVDPLAFEDLAALDAYLSERIVVLHAMENDLAPLEAAGITPPRVHDTAVAAGLLGLPTGLGPLLDEVLGVELTPDKQAMQRADWEERPLDPEMLAYAAADVADLPALWEKLSERLLEEGRLSWYEQELEALRAQPPAEERRHWKRTKGVGRLDRQAQGRAQALWETRERLGQETDTAPGRILSDKVLVRLAQEPPTSTRELGRRGMRRQAVRRHGKAILAAIEGASAVVPSWRARHMTDADRKLADTLREIRAERAKQLGIDAGLLCPGRTLLSAVLSDPETPEEFATALGLRGWQWDLLGAEFCEAIGLNGDGNAARNTRGERGDEDG